MINKLFKIKFPFAYEYFSKLLENDNIYRFPQSIILEGSDTFNSFYFALELSRILNCKKDKNNICTCPDCKWIKTYSHPAVSLVSQIHSKPDGDETKTQISTKQIREIEKSLTLSSDYHRFFIFFSSQKDEIKDNEFGYSKIDFSIEPLNIQVFNTSSANALLKSVEEPPENTTFIFLAKSREDILSTIVSRSQVFKLSGKINTLKYDDILTYMNGYFNLDYINALNLADNLLNHKAENDISLELILNKMIAYLSDILKQNIDNSSIYNKINKDISFISESIKHLRSSMSDKIVLEALMLKITRGY